jgi:hypothetical protein
VLEAERRQAGHVFGPHIKFLVSLLIKRYIHIVPISLIAGKPILITAVIWRVLMALPVSPGAPHVTYLPFLLLLLLCPILPTLSLWLR